VIFDLELKRRLPVESSDTCRKTPCRCPHSAIPEFDAGEAVVEIAESRQDRQRISVVASDLFDKFSWRTASPPLPISWNFLLTIVIYKLQSRYE
jgi:hypothetical protein